jgi:formate hydrogenlyase subunit 4
MFPGVFVLSLLYSGFDRKLHARMQRRVGPPLIQPFYDFVKLMNKERIIPSSASPSVFVTVTALAAASSILGASILLTNLVMEASFVGDIMLVMYLVLMTAALTMIGGSSSGNPYGAIGFSRRVGMLLGYEVPMLISLLIVSYRSGLTLSFYDMVAAQSIADVVLAFSPGAALASLVFALCIPAAAGVVPFDIPEAKTEVAYGYLVEYGGPYLGLLKLAKEVTNFTLSLLFFTLFIYAPQSFPLVSEYNEWVNLLFILVGSLAVYIVTITFPRTLFARVKLGQALRFYLWVWALSLVSAGLVMVGY